MAKQLINNFVAPDNTALNVYNFNWGGVNPGLSTGQSSTQSVIISNTLRRPSGTGSQKVDVLNLATGSPIPNNYEPGLDFTFVGTTDATNNVGLIARYTSVSSTHQALLLRYRANTGYQIIGLRNTTTIFAITNTQDLNPIVSTSSPMRRRIRANCVGNIINMYVDSYNFGTSSWTVATTPLLTRDISGDGGYTTGGYGLWFFSAPNTTPTLTNGYQFNEFYVEDLYDPSGLPAINSANTANVTVDTVFSYQITATNNPTSYTATGLPAGLSINTTTGLISGTPTAIASTPVTLTASNGVGTGGNFTLTINVNPPVPVINSPNTATAFTTSAFEYQITATNNPTSFTSSALPTGLSLNGTTGLISGTPNGSPGVTNLTLNAINAGGTSANFNLALTIIAPPIINSANTANGTTGSAFSYQITGSNNPTSFSSTALPTGLSLNTSTGLISGTPTTAGSTNVTLVAANSAGNSGNFTLSITIGTPAIPVVTSANTATGVTGTAFNYQITASNNPTSFNATGLPPGLSVNTTTGLISGIPTTAATTNVTITATNNLGTSGNFTLAITVSLQAVPVITSANTANATNNIAFSYQITATNNPTIYNATGLPAGLSINTSTGLISGTTTVIGTTNVNLTATNTGGTSDVFVLALTVSNIQILPNAPTNLQLLIFTPLRTDSPLNLPYFTFTDQIDNLIHLQWTVPGVTGTTPIIGYRLEQSTNNTDWTVLIANTNSTQTRAINITKPIGTVYYRVSAINSGGFSVPSDVFIANGVSSQVDGKMIQINGVWTFFTHPRSINFNGFTYTGWVNNAGIVGVTKTNNATKVSSSFDLEDVSTYVVQVGGAEIDDHDNAAIFLTADNRIGCFYGAHNDPAGMRCRISTHPEDINSFNPAIAFNPANTGVTPNVVLPTCYSNPRLMKDAAIVAYHFRTGTPPNAPHAIHYFDTADNPKIVGTYKAGLPLIQSTQSPWNAQRPYVQSVVNGNDRIDFFTTDGHPADSGTNGNGNGTSVYHFYIKWDKTSKTVKYYKSDGTEITTALPLRPKITGGGSDITQVWNGTTIRAWTWDIVIAPDGNPWVLFTTYDNGSNSFGYTNQRYRFSRWTGTEWTPGVDITGTNVAGQGTSTRGVATSAPGMGTNGVNGFTLNEPAYTGGCCFDSQNPNIVYLSNPVYQTTLTNPDLTVNDTAAIREIQEWRTDNLGVSWYKSRDITRNSPPNIINLRPYSPKNHDGRIAVVWCRGSYSGWVRTFNTNVYGASATPNNVSPSDIAPIGSRFALSRTGQIVPFAF